MAHCLAIIGGLLVLASCEDPLTNHPVPTVVWDIENTKGYVRTVAGSPPDTAYGWDFKIGAGTASWCECNSADACGRVVRQRQAADLLAIDPAGSARLEDGTEVEVVRLSLTPGRKYTVPTFPRFR
jgi:hypothetical protein